jgi:chromosomal replication initiator protein
MDVLILDDIHEMIGLDKTQNIFFHLFNHLHHLNKQIIMTSDKPPVDLQGMEERLITRLKWGLTAGIESPDFDLRKKILRNRIRHDSITMSDDVIDFIAENVTDNIRTLEGIVVSLMANSVINNKDIDMAMAKRIIGQAVRLEHKQLSVQAIQETVCKYFNIEPADIQATTRKREVVQARQIAMYLARKYTDSSLSHIGKVIGNRDHATVIYSFRTVKDQMDINRNFKASIEEIEAQLKN